MICVLVVLVSFHHILELVRSFGRDDNVVGEMEVGETLTIYIYTPISLVEEFKCFTDRRWAV